VITPASGVRVAVVRFRTPGQLKDLAVGELEVHPGSLVVVESERGTQIATVVGVREGVPHEPQHRVLRVVTDDDLDVHARNKVREREAYAFCAERIRALALPMKLVGVELAHSGSTALFSFTSNERVDFRGLVKDLARRFHTRIDMHQIGVRDAARLCGGIGVCGRALCCATCLSTFNPISVRMAKDQNLALNQEKLSGACGRLKCCLSYEEASYADLRKGLPKLGKRVITPDGEGRVKDVNVIKRRVRVQLADGRYAEYAGDEVKRPPDAGASPAAPPLRPDAPKAASLPVPAPSACAPDDEGDDVADEPAAAAPGAPAAAADGATRKRRRRRRRRGGNRPGGTDGTPSPAVG
jgi:cell fate regulator YaaT (PSP1 superfamily)